MGLVEVDGAVRGGRVITVVDGDGLGQWDAGEGHRRGDQDEGKGEVVPRRFVDQRHQRYPGEPGRGPGDPDISQF